MLPSTNQFVFWKKLKLAQNALSSHAHESERVPLDFLTQKTAYPKACCGLPCLTLTEDNSASNQASSWPVILYSDWFFSSCCQNSTLWIEKPLLKNCAQSCLLPQGSLKRQHLKPVNFFGGRAGTVHTFMLQLTAASSSLCSFIFFGHLKADNRHDRLSTTSSAQLCCGTNAAGASVACKAAVNTDGTTRSCYVQEGKAFTPGLMKKTQTTQLNLAVYHSCFKWQLT